MPVRLAYGAEADRAFCVDQPPRPGRDEAVAFCTGADAGELERAHASRAGRLLSSGAVREFATAVTLHRVIIRTDGAGLPQDRAELAMTDILSLLREEHENMAKLLAVLRRQIEEFEEGRTPDYQMIQAILEYSLEYSDLYHHPKEDLVFARLRERMPAVINTVNDLEEDHRKLAARTRRFAEAINNVYEGAELPRERVMQMADDFLNASENHMRMEDETIFPIAEKYLTDEDWAAIAAAAADREDPLFGPQVESMYKPLHDEIDRLG